MPLPTSELFPAVVGCELDEGDFGRTKVPSFDSRLRFCPPDNDEVSCLPKVLVALCRVCEGERPEVDLNPVVRIEAGSLKSPVTDGRRSPKVSTGFS